MSVSHPEVFKYKKASNITCVNKNVLRNYKNVITLFIENNHSDMTQGVVVYTFHLNADYIFISDFKFYIYLKINILKIKLEWIIMFS